MLLSSVLAWMIWPIFFIVSTSLCNDSRVGRPCWNGGEEQLRDNCHSSCMYRAQRLPGAGRLNTSEITSQLALACSCISKLLAMSASRTNGLQLTWAIGSLSSCFSFNWDHTLQLWYVRSHVQGLSSSVSFCLDDASSGDYEDAAWSREAGAVLRNITQMGCCGELAYRLV